MTAASLPPLSPMHLQIQALSPLASRSLYSCLNVFDSSSFPSSVPTPAPLRRRFLRFGSRRNSSLKQLTSRVVQLTRRKQLRQIFQEIEVAKTRLGKLNTIVMNAVMEACVHCGDIDSALGVFDEMSRPGSCGVDSITFATLLKGLGEARRIDEAFQMLESLEQGSAKGNVKLCAPIIVGLLNAIIESGDLRRANGLLARYGFLLRKAGSVPVLIYNLLMKGYINAGCPQAAVAVFNEILRLGLTPDRLTYNTLILACLKSERLDAAMRFFEEMKGKARESNSDDLYPDVITYTTLLKGFGDAKDLSLVKMIVLEMKLHHHLFIDRTGFTAMVDALLSSGSIKGALCVFGDIIKRAAVNPYLRPKPHLFLSMMRAFAIQGNYHMVNNLHKRLWPDSAGAISPAIQQEADHLLMEAALNSGQVDVAIENLRRIIPRWKGISWTNRGGMVAVRIEALLGFRGSILSPYLLPKISPGEPIETIMTPLKEAQPLLGTLELKQVAMRFFRDRVVPITDEWGNCIGVLYREDCTELNAPLATMMRCSPPCVTAMTSIGHVVDLILEKKYRMVVIIKHINLDSTAYSSGSRAVGVFTADKLFKLARTVSEVFGQDEAFH